MVYQFTNCQTGEYLQTILIEMGHLKLATTVATNNLAKCGLINGTIK